MSSERWLKMIEQYGSEEAAKDEMRRRSAKSSRNKVGTGGFAHMSQHDPDLHKTVSSKGGSKNKKLPNLTQ